LKLLDIDNFYSLMTTERCNFLCSYCVAWNRKNKALSAIESNIDAVCAFFETVKPGLITLSGGEPALAKNMAVLLKRLPQHKFAAFTNASLLPEWFFYDNFVLPIATYHAECIKGPVFIENVRRLFENGKRVIVKIIVKPDEEFLPAAIWEQLWSIGIPAHFVPLEYDYYFYPEIIHEISTLYLTSCLYNARFFKPEPGNISEYLCRGGTVDMFDITSEGYIQRCSTVSITHTSTIFQKTIHSKFLPNPEPCSVNYCYCEWHRRLGRTKTNVGQRTCKPGYGKNRLKTNCRNLSTKCIGIKMVG
jgi:hypothetical protein